MAHVFREYLKPSQSLDTAIPNLIHHSPLDLYCELKLFQLRGPSQQHEYHSVYIQQEEVILS